MSSGFPLVSILAAFYVLQGASPVSVEQLSFVDSIALGVIAFAAGSEIHLANLRSRIKSISYVTRSNGIIIPIMGTFTALYLSEFIPFV
jgi:hypothetical protein